MSSQTYERPVSVGESSAVFTACVFQGKTFPSHKQHSVGAFNNLLWQEEQEITGRNVFCSYNQSSI